MKASSRIVSGSFLGGEVEPGTFHVLATQQSAAGNDREPIARDAREDVETPDASFHAGAPEIRLPVVNETTDQEE